MRRRAERDYPKGDTAIMAAMIGLIGWASVIVVIAMMRVSGYIEVKEPVKTLDAPQVIPAPVPPTDFETDTTIEPYD